MIMSNTFYDSSINCSTHFLKMMSFGFYTLIWNFLRPKSQHSLPLFIEVSYRDFIKKRKRKSKLSGERKRWLQKIKKLTRYFSLARRLFEDSISPNLIVLAAYLHQYCNNFIIQITFLMIILISVMVIYL